MIIIIIIWSVQCLLDTSWLINSSRNSYWCFSLAQQTLQPATVLARPVASKSLLLSTTQTPGWSSIMFFECCVIIAHHLSLTLLVEIYTQDVLHHGNALKHNKWDGRSGISGILYRIVKSSRLLLNGNWSILHFRRALEFPSRLVIANWNVNE